MAKSAKKPELPAAKGRILARGRCPRGTSVRNDEADHCDVWAAWPSRKGIGSGRTVEARQSGFQYQAIARSGAAAISRRGDDRGNDAGHRLAAALGARFFGRRGAQAPQAEAHLKESGRQPRLPDRRWR